ncbi:MAG: DUF4390 domain-containing protein [Gammaproteobacteria bacterium]
MGAALLLAGVAFSLLPIRFAYSASPRPGFSVLSANTYLDDAVYRLNARLAFRLSATAAEALKNDVPLIIELQIQLMRPRRWLWAETVARLRQRYQVRYHALSRQYLVTNLNTGIRRIYPTRGMAFKAIGSIRNLPILDEKLLGGGHGDFVRLRVRLDIESLPLPLRPMAYLSSGWHLASDWYTCPVHS